MTRHLVAVAGQHHHLCYMLTLSPPFRVVDDPKIPHNATRPPCRGGVLRIQGRPDDCHDG